MATVVAAFSQFYNARTEAELARESARMISRISEATASLQERIRVLEDQIVHSNTTSATPGTDPDVQSINERLARIEDTTLALRQALDPLEPEEVLTIVRLKDRVVDLKEDFDQRDAAIQRDLASFRQLVQREIELSNNSTNLILVVLVPLVLNFLYTVWKDLRSSNDEKQSDGPAQNHATPADHADAAAE